MKKSTISKLLVFIMIGAMSVSSLTGCADKMKNFESDVKNELSAMFNKEEKVEVKSLDKSIEELVNEIEIAPASEDEYDREAYTSSTQYYVGATGEEYDSIRHYAFYESIWFDGEVYNDPYNGEIFEDVKGMDYDHIIPLHYANQHGASEWTEEEKKAYADDPFVGIDVNAHDNRSKSDKGPSEWMPEENKDDYAYTWLVIAAEYDLSIDQEDMNVILSTLDDVDASSLEVINQYK